MHNNTHPSNFPALNRKARSLWRATASGMFALALGAVAALGAHPAQAEHGLRPHVDFPSVSLQDHERGEAAIRALGARLPEVAKWYGKSSDEFAAILRRDNLARVDRAGRVYYVDEFTTTASGGPATINGALLPLDQTFKLHSRPGAQRTIYLDFNGYVATNTAWNSSYGLSAIDSPAYDLDGNPAAFSNTELERIQYIWQRVSEDYAPFDVDVTTEEPPVDALVRTDGKDLIFGTRVVITTDFTANTTKPCNCGGFAYLNAFDDTSELYKPAYVFYNRLGNGNEKYVAEAISHEAGHNLGLNHDGSNTTSYYAGHGSGATGWAPIMGVGYYQALVQWSKGEYPNANNKEDDFVVMQSVGAPLRADDHGDTFATATPLTVSPNGSNSTLAGDGVIGTRSDVDVFSFISGGGPITLNITPAARSANLDIQAELYDASGTLVAIDNTVDTLNASINVSNANAGTYYLKIDGVGKGDLTTGYSDYASVGQYVISGSISAASGQPPVAIASASPTSGTVPLTVSFNGSGSYDPDGGAVTYSWNFGDGSPVSSEANPVHIYNAVGNYAASLTVTDTSGASTATQLLIAVTGAAPAIHVEKIGMSLSIKRNGTRATATVTITDAAGKAISGATVNGNWSGVVSGNASANTNTRGQAKVSSPLTKSNGTFTFTVSDVSLGGYVYDATQNKQTSSSISY